MKILTSLQISTLLFLTSLAKADLQEEWMDLVRSAAEQNHIQMVKSHTGIFEGVYTFIPQLQSIAGDGNPAAALYFSFQEKLTAWAKGNGASFSMTQDGTNGQTTFRVKHPSGDYISAIYLPPEGKDITGHFTVVYVNASEFNKKH